MKLKLWSKKSHVKFLCCFVCSLKSMFDSPYFKENLTSFQQLLSEGVFDVSFLGTKIEDCKTLKRLVLYNSSKSKWVERYHQLKVRADFIVIRLIGKRISNMHFNFVLCTCRKIKVVAKDLFFPMPMRRCRVTSWMLSNCVRATTKIFQVNKKLACGFC